MFIRSLKINRPFIIKNTSLLTDAMLLNILETIAQLEHPQAFTALYLLAFFSFLRLSNMVPHSFGTFDILRHLARGDIIFSHDILRKKIKNPTGISYVEMQTCIIASE